MIGDFRLYIRYMKHGKMYCIYCYINKITGKRYVGQTCKSLAERAGRNGSGYLACPKFGPAILEYGWPNFIYEVLEDGLTKEEADEREKYWIEYFDSVNQGYNTAFGGVGHNGVYFSNEYRKRMAISQGVNGVLQYTKDGQFVTEYFTMKDASRQTGVDRAGIRKCCKGRQKSAGGYIWKYAS